MGRRCRSALIGVLGAALLFPQLAVAQPKKGDEIKLETTVLKSAAEYKKMLSEAEGLIADSDFNAALLKIVEIVENGDDQEDYFKDAEFLTGVALFHLGLLQSSYIYFERILDAEKKHSRYNEILPWLVALHQKIPGETVTLERMAEYPESVYPSQLRAEIYFNVGQFHYNTGTLGKALSALSKVTQQSEEIYLRAKYLEGVIYVRQLKAKNAAEAFKAILRYGRDRGTEGENSARIVRMALLSMARIFYTIGKYRTSIRYYDEIPDFSQYWLEALLEVSWAQFQVNRFGRALGNLHTLNSPYFETEYFPEARVLEAVILNRNCLYDDALSSIREFIKSYRPLYKELDQQLKVPRDPNQFYAWLARASRRGADISPRLKRIFNAALADRKLNRLFRFILHLNGEVNALQRLGQNKPLASFANALLGEISSTRALVIGEAGALAKSRLSAVRRDLRRQLSDALKVKFETLASQKRMIERNLKPRKGGGSADAYNLDSEHMYWTFNGEYWRDELDSYFVGFRNRCPETKSAAKSKP